jgi:hypothetical protein
MWLFSHGKRSTVRAKGTRQQEGPMRIFRTNGDVDIINLHGQPVTLTQLQEAVGGYIEPIPGANGRAYFNEEGRLKGLPKNPVASMIFGLPIVGDVVKLEEGEQQ